MANLVDKFKAATGINDPYATEILSQGDDLAVKYIPSGAGVEKIKEELTLEILNDDSNGGAIVIDPDKFLTDIATGNAKLTADIVLAEPLVITKDTVVDLNGYTLTNTPWDEDGESNAYMFWVKKGKLTLIGNGNVIVPDAVYSMAIWANGGDVEINGGTYKNGGDSCDLVYVSKAGKVEINGGEFIAAGPASGNAPGTKNPYSALNIKDANKSTCSISVKGGKFFKFNPADNLSENPKMNFVADGYEAVAEGDWFVVREAVLTGSTEDVVVEEETQE